MPSHDFDTVFGRLKAILEPYAPEMEVNADSDSQYGLQTHWRRPKDGYPGYFGTIKIGKRYVSYHSMPLYWYPELNDEISPALLKRKQGKACFNFTAVDDDLFAELERITRRGYEMFSANGMLGDG